MSRNDLTEVLTKAPRECWIALDEKQTRVVGRGETIADAIAEAKKNGIEDPIVNWLPKTILPSVFGSRLSW